MHLCSYIHLATSHQYFWSNNLPFLTPLSVAWSEAQPSSGYPWFQLTRVGDLYSGSDVCWVSGLYSSFFLFSSNDKYLYCYRFFRSLQEYQLCLVDCSYIVTVNKVLLSAWRYIYLTTSLIVLPWTSNKDHKCLNIVFWQKPPSNFRASIMYPVLCELTLCPYLKICPLWTNTFSPL